jgi:hypothetical protein
MKQQRTRVPGSSTMRKWQTPPVDVLKINTDGAFYANEKKGAWGFIVRVSDGHGILAGSGCLPTVTDALAAEGEACLAALDAVMERGISHVIIETDSTNMVKALQSSAFDQAPSGAIFRSCVSYLPYILLSRIFVMFHGLVIIVLMNWLVSVMIGTRVAQVYGMTPSRLL